MVWYSKQLLSVQQFSIDVLTATDQDFLSLGYKKSSSSKLQNYNWRLTIYVLGYCVKKFLATAFKILCYCVQNSFLLPTKFFVNLIYLSKLDDYIPFTVIENVHFPTLPLTSVAWIETLVLPILNFISLWSTGMLDIAGGIPELSESTFKYTLLSCLMENYGNF